MKVRQFFHLLREGFRNTWQNRVMALASVGVLVCCLMLTGFSYLIYVNVESMFKHAIDQNVVAVFLERDLTDAQVKRIGQTLENMDAVNVKDFISKEEYLKLYAEDLTEGIVDSYQGDKNPLPNTYIVSMDENMLKDMNLYKKKLDEIQQVRGVEEVSYDAGVAETLSRIRGVALAVGGGIIGVLLVVSLFIIVNTIKLTVYNRRLEIYIMKSVGATDAFIRFPFAVEGMVMGLLSGGLAYGIMHYLYNKLAANVTFGPMLGLVSFTRNHLWLIVLVGFLVAGFLTGVLGSVISMSRYLKTEGSEQV